jgi:hypothetical protein
MAPPRQDHLTDCDKDRDGEPFPDANIFRQTGAKNFTHAGDAENYGARDPALIALGGVIRRDGDDRFGGARSQRSALAFKSITEELAARVRVSASHCVILPLDSS